MFPRKKDYISCLCLTHNLSTNSSLQVWWPNIKEHELLYVPKVVEFCVIGYIGFFNRIQGQTWTWTCHIFKYDIYTFKLGIELENPPQKGRDQSSIIQGTCKDQNYILSYGPIKTWKLEHELLLCEVGPSLFSFDQKDVFLGLSTLLPQVWTHGSRWASAKEFSPSHVPNIKETCPRDWSLYSWDTL